VHDRSGNSWELVQNTLLAQARGLSIRSSRKPVMVRVIASEKTVALA